MTRRRGWGREAPAALAVAASLALAAAWLFAAYGGLFPLIEARMFLVQAPGLADLGRHLDMMLWPFQQTVHVSKLYFGLMRHFCGFSPVCVNAFQIALVAACAPLAYVLLRQYGAWRPLALGLTLVWLFCAGTHEVLVWQATSHDKLSLLFSLAALVLANVFFRHGSGFRCIWSNAVLGLLVFAAYNSKESSFFLGPLLAAQAVIDGLGRADKPRAVTANLAAVALPLAFSVYFFTVYFYALAFNPIHQSHVSGASALDNLRIYANFLFNINDYEPKGVSLVLLCIAAALFLATLSAVIRRTRSGYLDPLDRGFLFFLAFFPLSFVLVLKGKPTIYYMMIPSFGFYAAVFFGVRLLTREAPWRRAGSLGIALAAVALIAAQSAYFLSGDYQRFAARSRHFAQTTQALKGVLTASPSYVFRFVTVTDTPTFRCLLCAEDHIANFIFEDDAPHAVEVAHGPEQEAQAASAPAGVYFIFLDDGFSLNKVVFEGRTLYGR